MARYLHSLSSLNHTLKKSLTAALLHCSMKVCRWQTSQTKSTAEPDLAPDPNAVRVYDLLNVTKGNRFVVLGHRPMVVSNCLQGAGHSILLKLLDFIREGLYLHDVPYKPVVLDFHDETIFQVPEAWVETAKEIIETAYKELNRWCNSDIKISGGTVVCDTLTAIKCEG